MDDTVSGLWKRLEKLEAERDALRDEINKLGNGLGDEILKVMELQRKLNIAVEAINKAIELLLTPNEVMLNKETVINGVLSTALKKLEENK